VGSLVDNAQIKELLKAKLAAESSLELVWRPIVSVFDEDISFTSLSSIPSHMVDEPIPHIRRER